MFREVTVGSADRLSIIKMFGMYCDLIVLNEVLSEINKKSHLSNQNNRAVGVQPLAAMLLPAVKWTPGCRSHFKPIVLDHYWCDRLHMAVE